jgi:hypothetical protein
MKKYYTLLLLFSWACIQAQVQKSWEKVYTDFNPRNAKVNTDLKGNVQWLQSTDSALHFRLIQTDGTMLHHFEWKDSSAMTYRIAAPQRNASGATFFAAVTELYGGGETMNLFCLNDSAQLVWRYSAPVPSTLTCVPHDLAITQQHNYVLWNFSGFEKESWYLQKFDFQGQQTASLSSDTTRNQRALWLLAQEHQLRIAGQEMYQDLNKTFQIVSDTSLSITQSQSISLFNSHEYLADYLLYSDSARVYAINLESDSTGLDFAIAYQHEDSTQNWLFYYDGLAGYDDAVSGLASIGRRLFAAGYTTKLENAQLHKDYLLLCMSDDGQLIWEAHYDGPPGQMDDAELQIATDELDRIWVSGASYNGLNYDMFTCVYDTEGSLLYNFRYALDGDKDERPFRMIKDKVGGMILAGKSESDSTSHILLRYGDEKEKQQAIEKQLALLAAALVLPMQDTLIKSIVWKYVEKSYTDLWYVFIDEIVRDAEALNYPILSEMNKSVSWFFDLPPKDYVSPLLKRFYVDGRPYRPFIYVVEADSLSRQQWMDSIPWIAFSHQRDSMPAPALRWERPGEVTWIGPIRDLPNWVNWQPVILTAILPDFWVNILNRKTLVNCVRRKFEQCNFCFDQDDVIEYNNVGGSGWNHEVFINLTQMINVYDDCFSDVSVDYEFLINDLELGNGFSSFRNDYALLEEMHSEIPGWERIENNSIVNGYLIIDFSIKKTINPVYYKRSFDDYLCGHALTLCHKVNAFHDVAELRRQNANIGSLGLSMGKIYKISIPEFSDPLYFAYPYAQSLWFVFGPDLKVNYELKNTNCSSEENDLKNDFSHAASVFINAYNHTYSSTNGLDYIVSKNPELMVQYWTGKTIKVAFSREYSVYTSSENLQIFDLDSQSNCTEETFQFVMEFTLNENGEYEQIKNIPWNPFEAGDEVRIIVFAKYKDGGIINSCREIIIEPETLYNNQLATIFNAVVVEITGNIEDYQDSQTIYKAELWKRN